MKTIMDAIVNWLTILTIFLTQGALVAALIVLMGLLVVPEYPLLSQCLKWLKGLV